MAIFLNNIFGLNYFPALLVISFSDVAMNGAFVFGAIYPHMNDEKTLAYS